MGSSPARTEFLVLSTGNHAFLDTILNIISQNRRNLYFKCYYCIKTLPQNLGVALGIYGI